MGFFDTILDVGKDIGSGLVSGLTGGAVNLGGKYLEDELIGDPNSAAAYRRQKDFYKQRYQWMMKDMRKAGLNPILAAGSAGFSTGGTPSVSMSTLPSTDYASSAKNMSEIGKIEEETATERVRQLKTMAEVRTEIARKYKLRAEKGLVTEQERKIWFEIEKWQSEIYKNYRSGVRESKDAERLANQTKALAYQLNQLKNISDVYAAPASKALTIIKEIMRSLGINVGVLIPGIGMRK